MPAADLPSGDRTPRDFVVPEPSFAERVLKRPVRTALYPLWVHLRQPGLARRYAAQLPFEVHRWLLGQRGNDLESQRRRVNRLLPLHGARVLVGGCGTGRDVESWLRYRPSHLLGVDYFDYSRAWKELVARFARRYPTTAVAFAQADLRQLAGVGDASFDVVGSDAVFEHVRNLPQVVRECFRVLRPGGLLYATFGPLWYSWGGDHLSGYDGLHTGYNHLLCTADDYAQYVNRYSELHGLASGEDRADDRRIWGRHQLFSYLRPHEYIEVLREAGFTPIHVSIVIDPSALEFLDRKRETARRLVAFVGREVDMIVSGMTLVYRKP